MLAFIKLDVKENAGSSNQWKHLVSQENKDTFIPTFLSEQLEPDFML